MSGYRRVRWKRILFRGAFRQRFVRSAHRLRRSKSKTAHVCSVIVLSMAWLILPLLSGCGWRTEKPAAVETKAAASIFTEPIEGRSKTPDAPVDTGRKIRFRGMDNEYRGCSVITRAQQILHERDQFD